LGTTPAGSASAPGDSLRKTATDEAAVEVEVAGADEGTLEDPDVSRELPSEAATAATTTRRPTTRIVGMRRLVLRAGSR
jgi:hypothetical protein